MKKLFIGLFLVLMSPVIIFAGLYIYLGYLLPVVRDVQYYANRDKSCADYADPVRIKINNRNFTIPASYYDSKSLAWCWGGYSGYCTNSQSRKVFGKDESGEEITGFCQKNSDAPFLVKGANLFFDRYTKNALDVELSAYGLPDKEYKIKNLTLMHIQRWSKAAYCKEVDDNSPKLFGNPVIFSCHDNVVQGVVKETNCWMKGLVYDDVYFFQTGSFSVEALPPEYWKSYVREIENVFSGFMVENPEPSYPRVCANMNKESD